MNILSRLLKMEGKYLLFFCIQIQPFWVCHLGKVRGGVSPAGGSFLRCPPPNPVCTAVSHFPCPCSPLLFPFGVFCFSHCPVNHQLSGQLCSAPSSSQHLLSQTALPTLITHSLFCKIPFFSHWSFWPTIRLPSIAGPSGCFRLVSTATKSSRHKLFLCHHCLHRDYCEVVGEDNISSLGKELQCDLGCFTDTGVPSRGS